MDPGSLPTTWQDALENDPVSKVKAFEKQLRASASRDKEKLRALVGSNYRELLSTAEQIVELDEQNRRAESSISELGQACQMPDDLDTVASVSKSAISASQIRLTDRLLRCASRATKERSVLLASRLITIARLLVKHLEQDYGSSKTVQWLTNRLKNGRQQLLNCIDVIFLRPTTSLSQLIQAAGAYCLATSASSADVARHFRNLRAQRLAQGFLAENPTRTQLKSDLKQRCHYFVASVTAIKTLSGRGVVDLLNNIQKNPILEDRDVLAIETLQLDTIKNLLPTDILTFTPYFKRSASIPSEVRSTLQQWVNDTFKHLLKHIEITIATSSLTSVLKTRQTILEILLPNCFSTLSHGIITTSIRQTFSTRIINLIQRETSTLDSLGAEIEPTITSANPYQITLWESDLPRKLTSQPPPSCLRDIRKSHLGISNELTTYLNKLRKWLLTCQETQQLTERLSKIRWQDKIEEYDEDDEDVAQELIAALSRDDPNEYRRTFSEAADAAADSFIGSIDAITSTLAAPIEEDSDEQTLSTSMTAKTPTLLRITRETILVFTSLLPSKDLSALHNVTRTLHTSLAQYTTATLIQRLTRGTTAGDPMFIPPDLPSLGPVLLLKTLCTLMTEIGGVDIWTNAAVVKVKRVVLQRVLVGGSGEAGEEDVDATLRKRFVKSQIDKAYLRVALGGKADDGGGGQEDVQRRANMLWSRSRLLFGVLGG